jgi:drug/metabolite transporter (DMT)-like permease
VLWLKSGKGLGPILRLPRRVWLLGIAGLFGNHLFYFLALRHAPAAEANLINYLWPLLIVLFSAYLPGEHLRWNQAGGAAIAFFGAALVIIGGGPFSLQPEYFAGYLFAALAAVIWAGYSVLSRAAGALPTESVGAYCAATSLLALLCHLALEETIVPSGWEWPALILLGLGPMGAAFYVWDHGVKRGNIRWLGTLSYAIPFFSTLLLIASGLAQFSWTLLIACLFIVGGALLAAGESLFRPSSWKRRSEVTGSEAH